MTLQTMKIRALIASAAIAASTIIVGTEVQAKRSYCYRNSSGNTVCIHGVWRARRPGIKIYNWSVNGGAIQTTEANCRTANKYNYKANATGIACYEFN